MILKETGYNFSTISKFDLLGNNEEALSKALAYTISHEKDALFTLLRFLGIKKKNTVNNYSDISIEIEKYRDEGRTDIEIKLNNNFHVIIESKIKNNRVIKQRTQYLGSFDNNCPVKILCFLTQVSNNNKEIENEIEIINSNWFEITELFNNKQLKNKGIINDFIDFSMRNYKMNDLKEILIQDLGDSTEIIRFKEYYVYRRGVTFGTPLYFAPYFTNNAKQPEGLGIAYIAKVNGVLTLKAKDIKTYHKDLFNFSGGNKELIEKWVNGLLLSEDILDDIYTFYFLSKPLKLNNNLLKDGTREKGRGRGWIAAMIPKNRTVTFEEFINRLIIANDNNTE